MLRYLFHRICILLCCGLCMAVGMNVFKTYEQRIPGTEHFIRMIPIQGGEFRMGSLSSEAGHKKDEGPQHSVVVSDFWMAETEITWDQFSLFVERSIDDLQPEEVEGMEVKIDVDGVTGATTPYLDMSFGMGTDGYPATSMTQLGASRFCAWLSAMTGNFYRLPTEAEWEYACRAGSTSAYAFGEDSGDLDDYAWFVKNSESAYKKVKSKKPNSWGLYDMHGNVAEWTMDQYIAEGYKRKTKKTVSDPWVKPTKTYPKVLKGGSWKEEANELRSASKLASNKSWKRRDPQIPKSQWWHTDAPFIGFRIVRPVQTPAIDEQRKYWGY
ncbi:MAG: formylglycine-generating enzyme family protein [Bacteroidia bacterium]|nr:formylglycine-generating enzyme family protein [Bacteroidia bacterium]